MRRFVCSVLGVALGISLVGCSSKTEDQPPPQMKRSEGRLPKDPGAGKKPGPGG